MTAAGGNPAGMERRGEEEGGTQGREEEREQRKERCDVKMLFINAI